MNELSLFNSLFDDIMADVTPSVIYHAPVSSPRVDVLEDKDSYTLEMELPGRNENDVNIELHKDVLTIESVNQEKTEKKDEKEAKKEGKKYLLKERRSCGFQRSFTLPQDIDSESVTANFKNGVLTIQMQKKAIEAPKKIMIEAC